jgi:iron complex outermembrane receptor protein
MVQGDTYGGDIDQTVTVPSLTPPYTTTFNTPVDVGGGNLMGRWERIDRDNSDRSLAFYYERYKRNEPVIGLTRDTFDLDFQRRFAPSPRQEMVWGLGYRYSRDHFTSTPSVSMTPPSRSTRLFSGFIQDDIELRQDRLRLTVGSKFEHNDFSGFEVQPNVRLLYTPDPRRTLWGAISRAVRTPNRGEEDVRISTGVIPPGTPDNPGPLPIEIRSIGQRDRKSEELLAYEVGYRVAETERLFFDVAAFYNDYDHLRTYEPGAPFPEDAPVPHLVLPFFPAHGMKGQTYGIEVATDWQTADGWQVRAAYSYLQMQLTPLPGSSSTTEVAEGYSPHHQFSLRSSMDLPRNLELDLWLRYVDRLPTLRIGDYLTLDARLGWKPREDLEVTLGGQNLLDNRHAEFTPELYNTLPSQVQRGVYGKITWRF